MLDLTLKCYLIESAEKIIRILSKPITHITESNDDKYNLHSKWTTTYIDLYNSRIEFLLMGESRQNGKVTDDSKLFTNKFDKNYEDMKIKLNHIEKSLHMWNEIENDFGSEHFILDMDQKKKHEENHF